MREVDGADVGEAELAVVVVVAVVKVQPLPAGVGDEAGGVVDELRAWSVMPWRRIQAPASSSK